MVVLKSKKFRMICCNFWHLWVRKKIHKRNLSSTLPLAYYKKYSQRFRCNHSPLAGESQSQLVGDAERGQKLRESKVLRLSQKLKQKIPKRQFLDFILTPSQNFLAENFTLPQVEGDDPVSLTSFFTKCRFVRGLHPLQFFGNIFNAFGLITLPLRESRRANLLAMRVICVKKIA